MNKVKKNIKLSYALAGSGLLMIIISVAVLLSIKAKDQITKYKVDNAELYTYFGKEKIDLTSNLTLNRNNDITEIIIDDKKQELDSEPLYYKNMNKIILPSNMLIVYPTQGGMQKKVNYYSTISINENQKILSRNGKEKEISNTFLYDGGDLYIFMDYVNIKFNDVDIKISPLSYALCVYKDDLYIYNYEEDKVYYYSLKNIESDKIYATNDFYTINISLDLIKFNDESVLLTKNINAQETLC